MRRKRKIAPFFPTHPPFNPITGEYASLSGEQGVSPYCVLMQVAADDTYADYVICRGFDTRMLVFIDYEAGNPDKPGISVAKPYGNRKTGVYEIGEIYPALLPTQGNATYMPPSPSEINFRLGQNPGVVTGSAEVGGHPSDLSSGINFLVDHNGKAVTWLIVGLQPEEDSLYVFTLLSSFAGGSSPATISTMELSMVDTNIVYDPLQIFAELEAGDQGICYYQNSKYWAIQAACPEDEG